MKKENVVVTNNTPSPALRASSPSRGEVDDSCSLPPWRGKVGEARMRGTTRGFTLIELLVVVLIIGILAAVAVPQYQKAVEKSRLTEALRSIKDIQTCLDLYKLEHGLPSDDDLKDMNCPIELNLGERKESEGVYIGTSFETGGGCTGTYCVAMASRMDPYNYTLLIDNTDGKKCYTQETDMGRYICKSIENQGWAYMDREW